MPDPTPEAATDEEIDLSLHQIQALAPLLMNSSVSAEQRIEAYKGIDTSKSRIVNRIRSDALKLSSLQEIIDTHDLCHNLHGKIDARAFTDGCTAEQRKLYGCAPDADLVARQQKEIGRLRKAAEMGRDAFLMPACEFGKKYNITWITGLGPDSQISQLFESLLSPPPTNTTGIMESNTIFHEESPGPGNTRDMSKSYPTYSTPIPPTTKEQKK